MQHLSMPHPSYFACLHARTPSAYLLRRSTMPFETFPTVPEPQWQRLSERLRESVFALWQCQLEHPFVVALGNGSLPRANFEFYIRQDALFLDELTKTFAYAITKTADHEEMEQFGKFLLNTLLVEADLHQRYGKRFGFTPGEISATRIAPTNYAYTRNFLSIASPGTLPKLFTAILPGAWIYAEVGRHLVGKTPPASDHPYVD